MVKFFNWVNLISLIAEHNSIGIWDINADHTDGHTVELAEPIFKIAKKG
jgi:hypothetical protein